MSSTSTCFASSFSARAFWREAVVMPDVLATASACVSVSAADGAFIFAYNLREGWTLGIRCARRNRNGVVKRCMEFEVVVVIW